MDHKSKKIYDKIENFLEERKGRERRTDDEKPVIETKTESDSERRQKQDRRAQGN